MKINDILANGATQPREAINEEVVVEYAEALQNGAIFPPVVVFYDGAKYWLADGFHRYAAHKVIHRTDIEADIQQGTRRDAILYSVGANADHGLRRTNADKRRAVMALLNDDEWSQWSDSEIGRRCKVHHSTVAKYRAEISPAKTASEPRTYTTKYGTTATMNTNNIGKKTTEETEDDPEYDFEEELEDEPDQKPVVDIGDIPHELYVTATKIGGALSRLYELTCLSPEESARGFETHEEKRVVDKALQTIQWLERFVQAMEGK